jgi:membrane protein YdbS with pleckstrin-like domain
MGQVMDTNADSNGRLAPGEVRRARSHLHWITVAAKAIYLPVAAAAFVVCDAFGGVELARKVLGAVTEGKALSEIWATFQAGGFKAQVSCLVVGAAAALVVYSVLSVVNALVDYRRNDFLVTDHRVAVSGGILSRSSVDIYVDKVESVAVRQSLLGRLLGYGSVLIETTGGMNEAFHRVSRPAEIQRAIQLLRCRPEEKGPGTSVVASGDAALPDAGDDR